MSILALASTLTGFIQWNEVSQRGISTPMFSEVISNSNKGKESTEVAIESWIDKEIQYILFSLKKKILSIVKTCMNSKDTGQLEIRVAQKYKYYMMSIIHRIWKHQNYRSGKISDCQK